MKFFFYDFCLVEQISLKLMVSLLHGILIICASIFVAVFQHSISQWSCLFYFVYLSLHPPFHLASLSLVKVIIPLIWVKCIFERCSLYIYMTIMFGFQFFKLYLLIWKTEGQTDKSVPTPIFLPKSLQGQGWTRARNRIQEPNLGLPHGWQGSNHLRH